MPCTRAEAEALKEDIAQFATLDVPPVLMTSEADGEAWRMDAYFEAETGGNDLALLRGLAPSAAGAEPLVEKLDDEDWVTLSQAGLEPIRAGRFFVHTPAHRDQIPPDSVPFESTPAAPRHRPARDHHRLPDRAGPAQGDRRQCPQSRRHRHRHRPARLRRHAFVARG